MHVRSPILSKWAWAAGYAEIDKEELKKSNHSKFAESPCAAREWHHLVLSLLVSNLILIQVYDLFGLAGTARGTRVAIACVCAAQSRLFQ